MVNIERVREINPSGAGAYDVMLHGGWSHRLTRGYRSAFFERFFLP
jgi:hypothetical protein